ncbi:hypothetical protein [Nonomuraea africana]|uniref:Uncharacterized protein n=1 Tax=Nonomuraea africana TaxID=46171 RepID=A0ABR9K7S1_9ACTN|nr:hypothetical protein [Nonomuraea africana]MBE1558046.1 hypothetical protein [Nonomuraea africana]
MLRGSYPEDLLPAFHGSEGVGCPEPDGPRTAMDWSSCATT